MRNSGSSGDLSSRTLVNGLLAELALQVAQAVERRVSIAREQKHPYEGNGEGD
jgi:hypothetical protein